MTDRIRELIAQATKVVEPNDPDYRHEIFDKEKFAELIVKECMDIAHNVGSISELDDCAADRCYEIEQRIQDRFGVE